MRPSDWFLVDLSSDPTPGDAFGIRSLASKYAAIAKIAGESSVGVRNARSSGAASAWVGDAGDIFREKSERMPGDLAKANDSYELVADALQAWASALDDAQAQADRGLALARTAHTDLMAAQSALGSAERSWTMLAAQQLTYDVLQKSFADVPPPPGVSLPTPDQLRSLSRFSQSARSSLASAHGQVADAEARLAAARAMVLDAKARRDDAERTAVHAIGVAGDHAVQPSSIWEAIQDSAAWQVIVQVATVVLTVVSIVAIFVGGPLVWALILAATILLVVNALLSIAQGKDAWLELASLAVGLIPGGAVAATGLRVMSAISHVAGLAGRLESAARAATAIRDVVNGPMVTKAFDLPNEVVRFSQKSVSFNKIDRITGEHYTYDDIVRSMRENGWSGDAVDIVHMPDGGLTSIDNTRILAAREADVPVRGVIHDPSDPLGSDAFSRFNRKGRPVMNTWGEAIEHRINRQSGGWSQLNPSGTHDAPVLTGILG